MIHTLERTTGREASSGRRGVPEEKWAKENGGSSSRVVVVVVMSHDEVRHASSPQGLALSLLVLYHLILIPPQKEVKNPRLDRGHDELMTCFPCAASFLTGQCWGGW